MKKSAGILLYRKTNETQEFFLVHPGGPFFSKKDLGAWTIPKGEYEDTEEPLSAAIREFEEETGVKLQGMFTELTPVKLKSGKVVSAWGIEGSLNESELKSNTFEIEWPPKSGRLQEFPEVDKGEWFDIETAKQKINAGQMPLLEELAGKLK